MSPRRCCTGWNPALLQRPYRQAESWAGRRSARAP
jgi:hypothetical protein